MDKNCPDTHVGELLKAVKNKRNILIANHHNPDPDSLGAAFGLRHLIHSNFKSKKVTIGYPGIIGRAENKTMVSQLRIPAKKFIDLKKHKFDGLILCDTQPPLGNPEFDELPLLAVLDHHPSKSKKSKSAFLDIRTHYGATCSIVTEYLRQCGAQFDARVATALYYGIKADIYDRARKKSDADFEAMRFLFPKISISWISRIENPRLSSDYFCVHNEAIARARVYKNAVVTFIEEVSSADFIPQISDYLMRLENMQWALVVGRKDKQVFYSIRTIGRKKSAGTVARNMAQGRKGTGGGHDNSAAGRIELASIEDEKPMNLINGLIAKFLSEIDLDTGSGRPIGGDNLKTVAPNPVMDKPKDDKAKEAAKPKESDKPKDGGTSKESGSPKEPEKPKSAE